MWNKPRINSDACHGKTFVGDNDSEWKFHQPHIAHMPSASSVDARNWFRNVSPISPSAIAMFSYSKSNSIQREWRIYIALIEFNGQFSFGINEVILIEFYIRCMQTRRTHARTCTK